MSLPSSSRVPSKRFGISPAFVASLSQRLAYAALAAAGVASSHADLFWDPAGDGNGAIGGAGTWDTSSLFWDPTGLDPVSPNNVAWLPASTDTAVFGGTSGAVALSTGISAGGLRFDTGGYGISGGSLTLGGAALVNTVAGNSTIASVLDGSAGLVKTGVGTLTLSGANTYSGPTTVATGTLALSYTNGQTTAGSGAIFLNGTTLSLAPTANTSTTGLSGRQFSGTVGSDTARIDYTQTANSIRTDGTFTLTQANNLAAPTGVQWTGKLNVTTGGAYTFVVGSDDGSRLFVDGVLVVQNDGGKATANGTSTAITLSSGLHDIRIDYVNSGGNGNMNFLYSGPDQPVSATVPASRLFAAESNTTAASSNAVILGTGIGNGLSVSGASTVALEGQAFTQTQLGDVGFDANSSLTLTSTAGQTGKALRFGGSAVFAGNTTLNLAGDGTNGANLYFDGSLNDGSGAITITKQGSGRLYFGNTTSVNALTSGTTLDVQAGTLVLTGSSAAGSQNPIGSAGVKLSGGNLVLDSKVGSTTVATAFNNAVQVTENASIQAISSGGSLTTLGGAGTPINIASGKTLTLDAIAGGNPVASLGAVLNIAGNLTGGGNITLASTKVGTLTITPVNGVFTLTGNNTGYSGVIAIPAGLSLNVNNVQAATNVALAGTWNLFNDGNGTAAPETIAYDTDATLTGASTIVVNRLGTTFAPLFTTPTNKSIRIGDLTTGGFGLTVTNTNGYGLLVDGTTTLSGAESFTVANGTVATTGIAQGLTLGGKVTGGTTGITKAGAGTMVLTNNTNDFTGNITVTGGVLGASSDQALGNGANSIILNGAVGAFEAFGTFATNRSFTFSNATPINNQILVTRGNTLTINSALSGANGFQKGDPGTLVLTNNASTITGGITASGGVLRITQSGALGATSALTVAANEGTAFQLDGSGGALNFARPISLSGSTGILNNGALENFAGSNTVSGAVTLTGASTIGNSAAGTTLSLTGGVTGAFGLTFNGVGNTAITTTGLGAVTGLTRNGSGTTTISVASPLFVSATTVNGGTLVISGSGSLGTAAVPNTVTSGGTLWVDDTGTAIANRQGNTRTMNLSSATFRYTANASAASTETLGTLTSTWGGNTIRVDTGNSSTLTFGALNTNVVAGGSTLLFQTNADGTGATFNSATNKVVFTTAPTLTNSIIQRALVLDSTGGVPTYNFATYSAGIAAFTAYNGSNDLFTAAATDTMRLTATAPLTTNRTLNALASSGAGISVNSNGVQTLTLTSANLLVQSGDLTIGNNVIVAGGGTELGLNVAPGATLNVNGAFSNTNNLTVGLGGTVNFNARQFFNTGGNSLTINGGTVKLAGGNNTLYSGQTTGANQNLAVGPGGILDLNGNVQVAGDLRSPNNNAFFGSGGTLTSTGGAAMFVSRQANANWGGQITGPVTFVMGNNVMGNVERFYQDNTYTGRTAVFGGTLDLTDFGRLSGTSAIDLNYGVLNITNTSANNGRANLTDRVSDSAPITMRGGAILLQGRAQSASSETLGAVTLARGNSNLNVSSPGTGVFSAELTLTSLTQSNIDAVTNVQGASGQAGNTTRLFIGNGTSLLSNNILPVWIESGGTEFMSYNATMGAMPLSAAGAPGYTGTTLPTVNSGATAVGNYRIGASGVVPVGGLTVNTLNVNGAFNVTFASTSSTDVLNIGASGLMKSGGSGTSIGSVVDEGQLTAGGATPTGVVPLYLFNAVNGTSFTINSRIVDNGASPVRLIVNNYNGGTTAITNPNNTYTGGTVVNGWVNGNGGGLSVTGAGFIPAGGLTINNSTVTTSAAGQIDATNTVSLGASSTLTLVGDNTLTGLAFDNYGGVGNATVTTGGVLSLIGGISATSNSVSTLPVINGTLDFGAGPSTFNIQPIAYNGSVLSTMQPTMNIAAVIQNAGKLTVNGGGNLQLSGQSTFSGGIDLTVGGLVIGANSTPVNGSLISGPLGTGTLTTSSGTKLLSTAAVTVGNNLTMLGNTNFDGTNNLTFTGNTTLPAGQTINVAAPQQSVGILGNLVNPGANFTKTGLGTLNLTTDFAGTVTLASGGTIGFLADGNGTGLPETISSTGSVSANGAFTINVGRAAVDFAPYFTQALNKTIEVNNVTLNGNALTVNNNNGYGLKVNGGQVFVGGDQVYNVATASGSSVVQGLTLSGVVSGGFGIVKQGPGALVLNNAGNTFGGVGKLIDIQGGIVAANSDGALGNSNNVVRLNVAGTAGVGFRATSSFGTARQFAFNQATNAIEVVDGATLTIGSAFSGVSGTTTLVKNDNGTLTLAAPNSASWDGTYILGGALTGGVQVNGGALRIMNSGALGAATNPVVVFTNTNAAVQLAGDVIIPNPLTINHQTGTNAYAGGFNWTGQLRSVSGTNTWAGLIQENQDAGISADLGSTLNLTGGIAFNAHIVIFGGAGNINISSGALTFVHSLDKIGSGKTTIQSATAAPTGNGIRVFGGTLEFSGSGGAVSGAGAIATIINAGGTLNLDSSGSVVANRLGGRVMTLAGGNLNLIGGSTVTNEAIGAPTFARGQSTITVTSGAGGANLTFTAASNNVAPAQNAGTAPSGATVLFRGTSLGTAGGLGVATIQSTAGGLLFNGQTGATGTTNKAIMPWALIDTTETGLGISFATGDAAGGAGNTVSILRPLAAGEYGSGNLAANLNMLVTTGLAGQNTVSVNSLTFDAGGSVAMNAGQILTNQSGGILVRNGVSTSISGGVMTAPAGNSPWSIHTPGTASLAISSVLNGGNGSAVGLAKAGDGVVTLSTPLSNIPGLTALSANTLNMQTVVNQGTLRLAGGTNTLGANNFLHVSAGGTLDLNGTSQYVQGLFTDASFNGIPDTVTAGGTVTSATPATLVTNSDGRNWAGTITGNVFYNRNGTATATTMYAPQTYTGGTLINGGTLSLRDYAKLANTSAIDLNYAFLTLDNNTGAASISGRLGSAPVTMRGGTLTFAGRVQTASSDSIGSVTIAEGWNNITVTNGGTGTNSSDLTISSLLRPVGSTGVVNFANANGAAQQTGQLGSVSRLLIGTAPTLSNNIIGPWAIASREWASYTVGLGTGKLNDPGFAGYAPTTLVTAAPTDNVRITGTPAALTANTTVNTLNVNYTANTTVDLGGNTLTLAAGGLMFATGNDNTTATLTNGSVTSGAASGDLYVYHLPYAGANRLAVINASVVNNGANPVRFILSQSENSGNAKTVTINSVNTNTGGFVANLGTTVLGATGVLPAGGISLNSATLNQTAAGQASPGTINVANVVTLNGPATLNLVNNNTLAGIVFNNTGATSVGAAFTSVSVNPTVNSFVAGLGNNGTGTLTIGASGIVASSSNVQTTATMAGRIDTGASGNTITVNPIIVNGTSVAPLQPSLAIQGWIGSGAITKAGNGVLQLSSQQVYTGALNVTAGGVSLGALGNTGLAANNAAGSRFSALTLNANTFLNLNNTDGTIGSISGAGNVINVSATGGPATGRTLNLGFDNSNTTFSGSFARWNDALAATFQVNKIGSGTMSLTGVSTTTSNLQVSQGGVTFSGAGTGVFGTNLVLPTGTLTLDNSGTNLVNRLGGATNLGTLTVGGGNFRVIGNASAPTTETIGTVNLGVSTNNIYGTPIVTLEANPAQPLTFTVGTTWGGVPVGSSSLIRGISATAGNGLANFSLGTIAIGAPAGSGTGANGSTTMAIRPDILGDAAVNGLGTGFIVKDSVTNFLRPITAAELSSALASGLNTGTANYGVSSSVAASGRTIAGSLTLNAGGGVNQFSGLSATTPDGLPVSTVVNTGGILAFGGNTGITSSRLETQNNTAFHFHTMADLSVSSVLFGTNLGLNKGDAGTLTLSGRSLYTGQTQINAGTLVLAGGDNTLPVLITGGAPTITQLGVNSPTAVVNFNGTNQITGTIGNNLSARYAGGGGTYTNSSATPSLLTTISGSAQIFSGSITGNLSFTKTGNQALTFSNVNTHTGATNIRANTLTLIDSGALSGTSVVNLFYAGLSLDQSGLNPTGNLNPVRVPATVPVNLSGGTVTLTGGGSVDSSATFNTVNLVQAHSTFSVPTAPLSGTAAITIGNLARAANPDATVNFTGGTGGFFSNNPALGQSNIFVNAIDGVAIPATIPGKILGGWALAANGEFVTYISPGTTGSNGQNYGIVTMNGTTGVLGTITQDLYDTTVVTAAGTATTNVRMGANGTLVAGGTTFNAVAVRAANLTLTFAAGADVLNLASGGLALTSGGAVIGSALGNGVVTAGGTSTGTNRLYVYNSGAATFNSVIANNGSGGTTRLVLSPITGAITINGVNTYTGGTVVNGSGGTVTLASASSAIPAGGLTLNNVAVTSSVGGNIATSNDVILNGGSSLTLANAAGNTLNSLAFNNTGGTAVPTVAVGTTGLTLSATNAITVVNDNAATVPTISGTLLTLPAGANISTSTTAGVPTHLVISAPIASAGAINKINSGSLVLSGASTFAGGLVLNGGTLILGASSTVSPVTSGPVGTGTLTLGNGTALISDSAIRTIANSVDVTGNVTFGSLSGSNGSAVAVNGVILSGNVNLGAGVNRTITVNSHLNVSTISGIMSGIGAALTKAGPGTLALTGINTFDGGVNINGGVLQSTALGMGSTGAITFGGGILQHGAATTTDFSDRISTANNQPIYIDTNNQTVTYASPLTSATGGSLGKFGAGTLVLTNTAVYDGPTIIGAGTLQIGTGGAVGAIPTTSDIANSGTFLVNRGAADIITTASITGGGGVTIDQGTVAPAGVINLGGALTFGSVIGTTTIGNYDSSLVNSNFGSVAVQTNSNTAPVITLPAGRVLNVNGNFTVGYNLGAGVPVASTATTRLTVAGNGVLNVNNPTGIVSVGVGQGTQLNTPTTNSLDVSSLSSVNFGTVASPISDLRVAFGQTNAGTLLLSNTANVVTATTASIGHSNGLNGGTGIMTLGTGTNVLNVDTLNIGLSKVAGTVSFASQAPGSPGTVVINGKAGSGPTNMVIGSHNGTNTAATMTGTLDLRGHTSTVTAGTVALGQSTNNLGGSVTGIINFDTGTFTATSVNLGSKGATGGTGTGTGTINLSGGSFTVGAGGVTMATNTIATGAAVGNLNLTGGIFTTNGDIVKGGGTATTANITVDGGALDMTGKNIGSATQLIDAINLRSGVLANVGEINNGAPITKTTAGTLFMPTANAYTGSTTITGGVLSVASLADGGVNSSVGKSSSAAANLVIDGATLQYTGPTTSTDRQFTIGSNNATLDASGSGAVTFSNPAAATFATPNVPQLITFDGSGNGVIRAAIGNNGVSQTSIEKVGNGSWTLTGANTMSGPTIITSGALLVGDGVSGSLSGSLISVDGGTLGGRGTVGQVFVNAGGTVNPGLDLGTGTGKLSTSDIDFVTGSTFDVELGGNNAGAAVAGYDQLNVTGTLTIAGTLTGSRVNGFVPTLNSVFTIAINDGTLDAVLGEFANAAFNDAYSLDYKTVFLDSQPYLISYFAEGGVFDAGSGFGNDIALRVVPEPGSVALILGGVAMLARRRRRSQA